MLGAVAAARPARRQGRVAWPGSPARSACSPRRAAAAPMLDVAAVPRPDGRGHGRLADLLPRLRDAHRRRAAARPARGPVPPSPRDCGELTAGAGVRLRWPDGELDRGRHRRGDRDRGPA